jgi:putative NADH-flavin reductase
MQPEPRRHENAERRGSVRICILGATGNSGRALVRAALARGHDVTAVVRTPSKIADLTHDRLSVRTVSLTDHVALREALSGHDAVINAAGHVGDGAAFPQLVRGVIRAAEAALGAGGRLWLFGGAALLDVPGSDRCTLDLPGVPRIYEAHRTNYRAVRATELDWSMLCPGPMIAAPHGESTEDLLLSAEVWPIPDQYRTRMLQHIAPGLAFKRAVPRMTIYYEDAARVILDNLQYDGPFSRKRVGVALPNGETRAKPNSARTAATG